MKTNRGIGAGGVPAQQRPRRRRRLAAIVAVTAAVLGLTAAVSPAASSAAGAPVRDGSTSALAAPSCWAIKQQNPSSASGIYWLQTSTLTDPQQFYCDQTTSGG